ncbi:MAG: hypothetical protein GYA34_08515 [Chloroflexi bacterium]|nr:hypothetical protein [Chloroflexota bacterium]
MVEKSKIEKFTLAIEIIGIVCELFLSYIKIFQKILVIKINNIFNNDKSRHCFGIFFFQLEFFRLWGINILPQKKKNSQRRNIFDQVTTTIFLLLSHSRHSIVEFIDIG